MRKNIFVSFVVSLLLLAPNALLAEERYMSSTIDDVIKLNAPKDNQEHAYAIGGGGIFISTDSDLDDTGGGSAIARFTYLEVVSLEGNIDVFEVSVDKGGFDGDIFAVPTLVKVLLHSPAFGPVRFYVMGGLGLQFNDADVTADPLVAQLRGDLVNAPSQDAINIANAVLIQANAEATAASLAVGAGVDAGDIARAQASQEAANSRALQATEALRLARQAQKINLNQIIVPSGLSVDLDVDNGVVYVFGAGVDVKLADNCFWNTEVRYQKGDFDLTGSVNVPGLGKIKIDDEFDFDVIVVRTGFLIRI